MSSASNRELEALLAWAADGSDTTKLATSMPNLDHGSRFTEGSHGAANNAGEGDYPGGGVGNAPENAKSLSGAQSGIDGGLDLGYTGEGQKDSYKTVTCSGGSMDDTKMAGEFDSILKEAAVLDKLFAEAGNSNKAAAQQPAAPVQQQQAPQVSQAELNLVNQFKQAGEESAALLSAYQYGFGSTYTQLHKFAADGTIAQIVKEATVPLPPPGDPAADVPPDDAAMAAGGAPVDPAAAAAAAAAGAGGAPAGAGAEGAPASLDEIANALIAAGMQPGEVAALMQQLVQQMPANAPPEKLAMATKMAALTKAVHRHVLTGDFKVEPTPKSAEAAAFRRTTVNYIREMLNAAGR